MEWWEAGSEDLAESKVWFELEEYGGGGLVDKGLFVCEVLGLN